jgi:hypothetical protein
VLPLTNALVFALALASVALLLVIAALVLPLLPCTTAGGSSAFLPAAAAGLSRLRGMKQG